MTSKATHVPAVLVAQIGARRQYAVPLALHNEGLLNQLCTDAIGRSPILRAAAHCLVATTGFSAARRLLNRAAVPLPPSLVSEFPALLWAQLLTPTRSGIRNQLPQWIRKNQAFASAVAHRGFGSANTVYGFNTASLEIFRAASSQGRICVLDQTNAGWRKECIVRLEEWHRWPDWEPEPPASHEIAPLAAREEEEWERADLILCGSPYVADQLANFPGIQRKCRVVTPGRSALASMTPHPEYTGDRSLNVLFAGTLELRKGIQYLHQAARELGHVDFRFRAVGPVSLNQTALQSLVTSIDALGPASYSAMSNHYAWADVLVLPSLSEGSAGVCAEALMHGLPVITTYEAGSTVIHEKTGLLIPARSHEAIVESLRRFKSSPDLLRTLRKHMSVQHDDYTIAAYGRRLRSALTLSK